MQFVIEVKNHPARPWRKYGSANTKRAARVVVASALREFTDKGMPVKARIRREG